MPRSQHSQKITGILLGRFQPLHLGHIDALGQIKCQVHAVKILIGSSNISGTPENPLSFTQRKAYMRSCGIAYPILPLPDNSSDEVWCQHLRRHMDANTILFSANDRVLALLKKNGIPCISLKMNISISATQIRNSIRQDKFYEDTLQKPLPKNLIDQIRKTG